jgi:hypothetical protein
MLSVVAEERRHRPIDLATAELCSSYSDVVDGQLKGGSSGDHGVNAAPQIFAGRYAELKGVEVRRGGMAAVYECSDLGADGLHVAVKLIDPPKDVDHLERLIFERELNVQELVHPNIVRLLDFGQLPESNKYYLVYEWVPRNLKQWLLENPQVGADDFLEAIGLPVMRGLALAHERQIVHRDVKPSNILVTDDGVPKLADFGISKVKYKIAEESGTLYDFSSKPFSPPESESHSSYSRDVFGYGVVLLSALANHKVEDYPDFDPALDTVDASPALLDVIGRCVSLDVAERPRNAVEVLGLLESLQRARRRKWKTSESIHFSLTRKARLSIVAAKGCAEAEAPAFVETELEDSPAVRLLSDDPEHPRSAGEKQAFVYGTEWSFRIALSKDKPTVDVLGALQVGSSECDERRDKHFVAEAWRFVAKAPLDHAIAITALERLVDAIEMHAAEVADARLEREDQRLFDQWGRQLDAREAVDQGSQDRLRYRSHSLDGQRASFDLIDEWEAPPAEQRRMVLNDDGFRQAAGIVEEFANGQLVLYLDRELSGGLPPTGILAIDTQASREKLRRERRALNALRFGGAELRRTDLPHLLIHPEDSKSADAGPDELEWFRPDLDESKRGAVRSALVSPDFFLVQGPPGTGKTTFIAELVAQEIARDPRARILLASQTNVALDNALVRVRELSLQVGLLRLGNPAAGKIADDVRDLTLDHQLDAWRSSVRTRSEKYLERIAVARDIDLKRVRLSLSLGQLASLLADRALVQRDIEHCRVRLAGPVEDLDGQTGQDSGLSVEEISDVEEEIAALEDRRRQLDRDARQLRERREVAKGLEGVRSHDADEVRRAAAEQLSTTGSASDLTTIVDLQARWLERLGRGPEFQAALLAASNVVAATCVGLASASGIDEVPFDLCILDEASKAAATEALVPMIRAKRWVMVGDEKQLPPFQDDALHDPSVVEDFGLDLLELQRTLFSRLAEALPAVSRTMLSTQYRMLPEIGNLISSCFYGDELQSAPQASPWKIDALQPSPVMWYSTEQLVGHEERRVRGDSPGYMNSVEAAQLIAYVRRLDFVLANQRLDRQSESSS